MNPFVLFGLATLMAVSQACVSDDAPLLQEKKGNNDDGVPAAGNEDPLSDEEAASAARVPPSAGAAAAQGEPVLPRTAPAALPLPSTRTYYGVRRFLQDYNDAYRPYVPLQTEYRIYFQAIAFVAETEDSDLAPLRTRIREDVERAHWAYVAGVHETLDFLATRSRDMLQIDKEKNVLARLRVLTFLAAELDESAAAGEKYRAFVRGLYVEIAKKHFGRDVKARGSP